MKRQTFIIDVYGFDIKVDFNPKWSKAFDGTIHIEFYSEPYESPDYTKKIYPTPNPISETGYRSHFIMASPEQCGITNKNVAEKCRELAMKFADENESKITQSLKKGQTSLL